ncbi:uncharacterized protein LDX57_007466 [Aspergillus melleus]|uniref:uncharacterized protein n=1 Tax=Aspergillus melleus TaxID=138277 RepID=UPI001E8CF09B|nr:uncharacterized protein LDX57_007466 [Aspergillus melleus]KAH8429794.1 hypothetical protein LDX57_007466 [Aspergillus melleus]
MPQSQRPSRCKVELEHSGQMLDQCRVDRQNYRTLDERKRAHKLSKWSLRASWLNVTGRGESTADAHGKGPPYPCALQNLAPVALSVYVSDRSLSRLAECLIPYCDRMFPPQSTVQRPG